MPFGNQSDESRNIDIDGTAGNTAGFFALDAALGLGHRQLLRIAEGNLIEVVDPHLRILFRHLLTGDFFLFLFDVVIFHGIGTYRLRENVFPDPDTSANGWSAERNPPHGRQIPDRPHR